MFYAFVVFVPFCSSSSKVRAERAESVFSAPRGRCHDAPQSRPEPKNLIVPRGGLADIAALRAVDYFIAMFNLTRQQQLFLCSVLLLLVVGWTVRAWRLSHPPEPVTTTAPR